MFLTSAILLQSFFPLYITFISILYTRCIHKTTLKNVWQTIGQVLYPVLQHLAALFVYFCFFFYSSLLCERIKYFGTTKSLRIFRFSCFFFFCKANFSIAHRQPTSFSCCFSFDFRMCLRVRAVWIKLEFGIKHKKEMKQKFGNSHTNGTECISCFATKHTQVWICVCFKETYACLYVCAFLLFYRDQPRNIQQCQWTLASMLELVKIRQKYCNASFFAVRLFIAP